MTDRDSRVQWLFPVVLLIVCLCVALAAVWLLTGCKKQAGRLPGEPSAAGPASPSAEESPVAQASSPSAEGSPVAQASSPSAEGSPVAQAASPSAGAAPGSPAAGPASPAAGAAPVSAPVPQPAVVPAPAGPAPAAALAEAVPAPTPVPTLKDGQEYHVSYVYTGNQLELLGPGLVYLKGVPAPGEAEPGYFEARLALKRLALWKPVILLSHEKVNGKTLVELSVKRFRFFTDQADRFNLNAAMRYLVRHLPLSGQLRGSVPAWELDYVGGRLNTHSPLMAQGFPGSWIQNVTLPPIPTAPVPRVGRWGSADAPLVVPSVSKFLAEHPNYDAQQAAVLAELAAQIATAAPAMAPAGAPGGEEEGYSEDETYGEEEE